MKIVDQFLEKADPKDKVVHKALGISEKGMEIFWAALTAAGEDLAIPNLTKVAGKIAKFPAPYINKLKKAKLVVHGKGKGKWGIADAALKKMEAVLKGEVPVTEAQEPKVHQTRKRRGGTPKERQAAPPMAQSPAANREVRALQARIKEINTQIEALEAERGTIALKLVYALGMVK